MVKVHSIIKQYFFYKKNMKGTLRDVCLDWAVIACRIVYSLESTHLVLGGWKTVNNLNSSIKLHHQDLAKITGKIWSNLSSSHGEIYASKKLPANGFSGILHLVQGVYRQCFSTESI